MSARDAESGRARLHKYVDVEPVEQAVHVFHEEYEVSACRSAGGAGPRVIAEAEQEIILHEERPVFRQGGSAGRAGPPGGERGWKKTGRSATRSARSGSRSRAMKAGARGHKSP